MALIDITRKTEVLQAWQINTPQDMYDVLAYISQGGWGGHINCTPGSPNWTMGITSPTNNVSQSVVLTNWVVIKNSAEAEVVTDAQYQQMYQST